MRIACPACHAVYEVPGKLLAENRPVRCARCGQEWLPEAEPERAARPPAAAAPRVPVAPGPPGPPALPEPPGSAPARSLAERAARAERQPRVSISPPPPASRLEPRVPVAPPPPADPMLTVFPPLVGRPVRRGARSAAIAWAASLLLIVLILAAAYVWRAEVQAAWPPIQRAYAAIGLR